MITQSSSVLNTAVFDSLMERAQAVNSCESLQVLADDAMEAVDAQMAAINAELAMVEPILDLLTAPDANLTKIVTWITDFITVFLTPYTKPTVTYAAQLADVASKVAELSALMSTLSAKFPSCNVTIPPTP